MSAPAPYWGKLPPPKVARTASGRRIDIEHPKLTVDTRGDQYLQDPGPSQPRQNRYSSQTATTNSTQSPFTSPIASSFHGDGLKPRPASYQQADPDSTPQRGSNDYLEKRRRRESRNRDELLNYTSTVPPAPDVPRAPPLSYKAPYNEPPIRSSSTRNRAAPEEYYYDQGEPRAGKMNGKSVGRSGTVDSRRGQHHNTSEPRRGSTSAAEEKRRREWAQESSPLQRLELTLDSITKEEKRARVEEAEQLAKEAQANQTSTPGNKNGVRFRNRPVAVKSSEEVESPITGRSAAAQGIRLVPKEQSTYSSDHRELRAPTTIVVPGRKATKVDIEPRNQALQETPHPKSGTVPQRGSSTRSKASVPIAAATLGAVAGAGLVRSDSNKLKKSPPGDPWYHARKEVEEKGHKIKLRNTSLDNGDSRGEAAVQPYQPAGGMVRRPIDELETDLPVDRMGNPMRRGSIKKIEQLTGHKANTARVVSVGQVEHPGTRYTNGTNRQIRTEDVNANDAKYVKPSANLPNKHNDAPRHKHDHHHFSDLLHRKADDSGVYVPSPRLDEWKKASVALLSGALLDLDTNSPKTEAEKDRAWWEAGNTGKRRTSVSKPRKAEAYDGEYDTNAPTRFKPPLFLKSGPLLRYCGLRRERSQNSNRSSTVRTEREIWRGSIMIVTADEHSSYELAPTLRLFSQPQDLLPPPPEQLDGTAENLRQEYVDPIGGLPKLGRDGRTLYIRPVEHLEEEKDVSRLESDEGLFEMQRSNVDGMVDKNPQPLHSSKPDGEKLGKYKEVRGFRLHAERGVTFWRFNIGIELKDSQQRIAYRINRGPATSFWVPGRNEAMNIMFHSCNGFSMSVKPDQFSGPDPMWRDVLNTHQTRPFHVMLGGGDQIYNDAVMEGTTIFKDWLAIKNPIHKEREPFTPEMQDELESFYLQRYCMWFSQGLFGVANSQIPMVNIFDDHDIIDGFGSYPHHYMRCPVMCGLGSVAFKYYMLFQHQSSIDEGEEHEPSWVLGTQPGPYIPELSRSIFTFLGRSIAFLGLDCRTERMHDEVLSPESYDKIFNRLEKDIVKGVTKHLIVLLGVPIAYPRMVWLETILTSRMFEPVKALGRAGILGKGLLNKFDGGVEVLDDLDDHWTAKNHKAERNWFIQELQELAASKSVRITILGGDVHLGAIGQFYSNPKLKIPKDKDYRYMPNVISSAIVNTPPPDMLADVLNKRNKVHHLDSQTDEDMIPIFTHDVTGKPRNNKRLLNRRNWCSIREYSPELTPPPTPDTISEGRSPSPPPKRGLLRRFSTSKGPSYRPDAAAPPLSNAGFFERRSSFTQGRPSVDSQRPGSLTRTLSLTRRDFLPGIFKKKAKPDDGGINGYGADSESDISPPTTRSGLRGGSGRPNKADEEDYFSQRRSFDAANPIAQATTSVAGATPHDGGLVRTQFHRTPTGLSEKQRKSAADGRHDINLEGGLDICLNMEVNQKDPSGITMPFRLLVPRLWYEPEPEVHSESESEESSLGSRGSLGSRSGSGSSFSGESYRSKKRGGGLTRLMSFKRKG